MEASAARVAAVAVRRREAEEAGDILQTTDCDIVTQSKRGKCGDCGACAGFCIHFRCGAAVLCCAVLCCAVQCSAVQCRQGS